MTGRSRSRWPRLAILAAIVPLAAVTTCDEIRPYSTPSPARAEADLLRMRSLDASRPEGWPAGLTLEGSWELSSLNRRFGSYSALVAHKDGSLTAYSDRGYMLDFADPVTGGKSVRFGSAPRDPDHKRGVQDLESAAYDPASDTVWLSFEQWHGIRAVRRGLEPEAIEPQAMAGWPANGGAEAMARLQDGRFIVLAERDSTYSRDPGEGLLFARDPLLGDDPVSFRFVTGGGFQPSGMAALPDGRVLILLRALDLALPPFRSRLVIADPRDIEPGKPWPWQLLADIADPPLRENYEGLAVAPRAGGGVTIWLISDDNDLKMQRSLLLRLAWVPPKGGRN